MQTDPTAYSTFVLAAMIICFAPGPMTLLGAITSARCGLSRALPLCVATGAAYGLILWVCSFALFQISVSGAASMMSLGGTAILFWVSWRIFSSGPFDPAGNVRVSPPGPIPTILINLCNPKAWAACAGLSSMLLEASRPQLLLVSVAVVGFAAFSAVLTWAVLGQFFARMLESSRRQVLFNRVAGLSLAGLALHMATA